MGLFGAVVLWWPGAALAQAGMPVPPPISMTTVAIGAVLVTVGVLIGLILAELSRDNRALDTQREREASERRTETSEAAELRFLTTLSHDLRTPMNGVMGLMALVRQSGLSLRQDRLMADAERLGGHLVHLLADLLDYAQLRTGTTSLDRRPVDTGKLVKTAERCLADRARLHRMVHTVAWDGAQPEFIEGDEARLRQIITHLCAYVAETVRAAEVNLRFLHENDRVMMVLRLPCGAARNGAWRADDVLGQASASDDPFESDATGPMIVRGLTRLMEGEIEVDSQEGGDAVLTFSIPAPECVQPRKVVRFELSSDASALLLHALLDEESWDLWTPDVPATAVSVVVFEGDSAEAASRLSSLREHHPQARFVSLGEPFGIHDFDAICPASPGAAALEIALSGMDDVQRAAV